MTDITAFVEQEGLQVQDQEAEAFESALVEPTTAALLATLATALVTGAAALTIGGVVGQVARLPTGVGEGSHTDDPNLLVDLPSETKVSWFIASSSSSGARTCIQRDAHRV